MGDIARCSLGSDQDYHNEELLYHLFGVNAELLIDHSWGWEPVTMDLVKAYKPESNSLCSGQVLRQPYDFSKGKLIVQEMTDLLALDLVDKRLVTDQITLTVGYDRENLTFPGNANEYKGEITTDRYGRKVPKHAHGTINLDCQTSSACKITDAALKLYDQIVDPNLLIRRVMLSANHLVDETQVIQTESYEQLDLFTDYTVLEKKKEEEADRYAKERRLQEAMLSVKKKYGKNAILKGMNLQKDATTMERNRQIGGHKA